MTRDNFQVKHVNPAELAKPSGFSHAVRVTGGTTVYLAGQTCLGCGGRDPRRWQASAWRG